MPRVKQTTLNSAVCVVCTLSKPGLRRQVSPDEINVDDPWAMLHISKDLVDSPEFKAIASWDRQLQVMVTKLTTPFPLKHPHGLRLLAVSLIDEMDTTIRVFLQQRQPLIQAFLQAYPRLIEESQEKLGPRFDPSQYPTTEQLERAFGCECEYLELSLPPALYEVAEQQTWESLRNELTRLISTDEGKLKAVRASLLDNLQDFLYLFESRNLFGASDLSSLVQRCQAVVGGIRGESLAGNAPLREAVTKGLEEVQVQLQSLVTPRRKLRLVDDD